MGAVHASPRRTVARLETGEQTAHGIADLVTESFAVEEVAVDLWNAGEARWQIAMHFRAAPDQNAVRKLVATAAGAEAAKALVFERSAARDWVRESLRGLKPVAAGRFVVHGAHDRARVPVNAVGIEVEAALAFGTGHHGTTRGCLLALDRLCKSTGMRPRRLRILDLGTGSGVLAVAAARALRRRVLATDVDPAAVRAARANARLNRAAAMIEVVNADGVTTRAVSRRAPFDLVFANILLGPLQRIATPLQRLTAPGCRIVLSGLLPAQAGAALAAYRAFALERRIDLDGWTTLVLARRAGRRGAVARRRPAHRLPPMFAARFQSFEDSGDRGASAPHVAALRAELARRGLDGFVVPRADRFQNEYVPPCAERLAWLTGFTGSAGLAIVLADGPSLFVDGRYQVQVREEVDGAIFSVEHSSTSAARMARSQSARRRDGSAMIPGCTRLAQAERFEAAAKAAGAILVAVRTIRSTRSGPTAAAAARRGACCTIQALTPAKSARTKLARVTRRARQRLEPTRSSSAIRMRSPGRSTSAAATRAYADRARLRVDAARRAGRRSTSTAASSQRTCGRASKRSPSGRALRRSRTRPRALGAQQAQVRFDACRPRPRSSRGCSPSRRQGRCSAPIRSR